MFGVGTGTVDLTRIDRRLTRAVILLTGVVGAVYLVIGSVTGETSYLWRALGVFTVGVFAAYQVLRNQERLWQVLALAAVMIVIQGALLGSLGDQPSAAPGIALVIVGIAASLFVARRLTVYIGSFSALVLVAHILWQPSDPRAAMVEGVLSAVIFAFVALVFSLVRRELERSAMQYRWLFHATPVTIRVEDFRKVGSWLESLRAQGVDDLRSWLNEDAQRVLTGVRLVRVVDVNAAGVAMLEAANLSELLGPIPESGVTDESRAAFVEQFVAIWEDVDHLALEVPGGRTLTKKHLDLLLYWNAPRLEGRLDLSRVTVAMVDVTDLRQTERNLVDLLRSKDEFVATISHELRTPLTTVVGLSEELRDAAAVMDSGEVGELLGLLASEAVEVSSIVEDLLTAARVDSDAVAVVAEDVDLNDQVTAVLRTFGDHPVETVSNAVAVATADASRVRQVLRNLLVNAQRYGGDTITIRISSSEGEVAVAVCDDGSPLPEHQRQAIFERYYRAGQRPGLTASVGLGLAVSRELARLMAGDLTYHHDGSASIFTLVLPAAAANTAGRDWPYLIAG